MPGSGPPRLQTDLVAVPCAPCPPQSQSKAAAAPVTPPSRRDRPASAALSWAAQRRQHTQIRRHATAQVTAARPQPRQAAQVAAAPPQPAALRRRDAASRQGRPASRCADATAEGHRQRVSTLLAPAACQPAAGGCALSQHGVQQRLILQPCAHSAIVCSSRGCRPLWPLSEGPEGPAAGGVVGLAPVSGGSACGTAGGLGCCAMPPISTRARFGAGPLVLCCSSRQRQPVPLPAPHTLSSLARSPAAAVSASAAAPVPPAGDPRGPPPPMFDRRGSPPQLRRSPPRGGGGPPPGMMAPPPRCVLHTVACELAGLPWSVACAMLPLLLRCRRGMSCTPSAGQPFCPPS